MPKYQCLHFVFLFALHLVNLAASLEEYVFYLRDERPFPDPAAVKAALEK